jgi:type IV secretory pathway VirB2 component (pilin)
MYGWIWRHLPGPLAVRLAVLIVLFCGVIALLFFVVFPAVDPLLPFNNVTSG